MARRRRNNAAVCVHYCACAWQCRRRLLDGSIAHSNVDVGQVFAQHAVGDGVKDDAHGGGVGGAGDVRLERVRVGAAVVLVEALGEVGERGARLAGGYYGFRRW